MPQRFKYAQISAVNTLIENGWSVSAVAAEIHGRYGYASKGSCGAALRRCLRLYGFNVPRNGRPRGKHCSRCGVDADQRMKGCKTCASRHGSRRRAGDEAHVLNRHHNSCAGCGCHWDKWTRGCGLCARRHWKRKHTPNWKPAPTFKFKKRRNVPGKTCSGCGGEMDSYTDGCGNCWDRRRRREQRQRTS